MTQYIDKSALVAEIEKRIKILNEKLIRHPISSPTLEKLIEENKKLLSFINTLEVKEVDFSKCYREFLQRESFGNPHVRTFSEMMAFTAKHFFELGLSVSNKSQKGE